ncbi:Imidazole glycerol phosphate synthase subunit HisH 1 [uncultured Flavonifractor sp.]|uniref:imidazole glycerol phosphate synthase subunit HisH n=1 Tax=Eubacteriales TaxID=186802 RepID=UPI000821AD94|nr:imidazole glycerol phosphate synthase subunit HisH [Muriventricola aceti]MBS5589522.1 imidazole glycerol phosphate synthase subunit HisH [Clostridiales bacterium]MCU6703783.1 imidazole glycerol phosphate synthase subunit HisH [Muriventricola aceti]SCI42602.1 Imidazole glycerol phosphate synthase subunit HisH 1 [uncultured Flavonifractor sp.]SCJ60193.1 Imidazole glycerol phosphate synthase subunit HisH 1 [uncultured Flavonifractor sp.]
MSYIAVVDYGVGNLKSVSNAFAYLGIETKITGDPDELELAQAIVLPGVGAFPDAADKLRATGLDQSVVKQGRKKPVLGICLGMQLLLDRGEEVRPCPGLGVIKGVCARIPTEEKLPHIGWNSLTFPNRSPLFEGVDEGSYVYFVHSFSAQHTDPDQVSAVSQYGVPVIAAVQNGNFFGCQFHPEKSGETGLAILQNFAGLTR